jgi:hypothetical protein
LPYAPAAMRRVATIAVIACAALAGCGGGDDEGGGPEDAVREAVRDYLTAVASGNHERACSTLTNEAQETLVAEVTATFAEGGRISCGDAVQELSADIAPEDKQVLLNPKVGKVTIEGTRATAEVERLAQPTPLRQVGEDWRVEKSSFEVAPR